MKKNTENSYINKIHNVDSRKFIDFLDEKITVKTTITSPPYFDMKDYGSSNQIGFGQSYDEYLTDLQSIFGDVYKITDNDGSLWIIIDSFKRNNQVVTLPFDLSNKLKELGWFLQDIIIWKKDKTVPWSSKGFVQRKFEYILFFTKSNEYKYNKDKVRNFDTDQLKKWWVKYPERYNPKGKALDEIWEFPIPVQGSWGDKYIRHFCPLPKEMVATMIDISTNEKDIVLDPFAGSGSVLFQSVVMNREYIGFELNQEYIEMFNTYLDHNKSQACKEYELLGKIGSQDEFQDRILNLRALKYGRLLINELEKRLNIDLKVFVEIKEYYEETKTLILVNYEIIGLIDDTLLFNSVLLEIASKAPFSKFGIKPNFILLRDKELIGDNYYTYTKSNSYSYSNLPPESSKVKVISKIKVNLNENDYC